MTTFISYSRANSEFAVRFARDLRNAGFDIWLDQLDIPKGSRWDDEVERALESSSTFMIVLAPQSIESQNVKDEIAYAIDAGKHILPVLLQPCKIPFRLRRFQFVDFTNKSYQEGLAEIQLLLSNTKELAAATDDEQDFQKASIEPALKRSIDQGISVPRSEVSDTAKPGDARPHRKWDPQVIIALMGLVGTVLAAFLGSPLFDKWFARETVPTAMVTATTRNDQISNTQASTVPGTVFPAVQSITTETPVYPVYSTETDVSTVPPNPIYHAEATYSFIGNLCNASWSSGAGELPCPGTEGDAEGFVLKLSNPRTELGVSASLPAILTVPQNITDGYIQGLFPLYTVQDGDRFVMTTSCERGATSCYVNYRLDYQIGSVITTFWSFRERSEGITYNADLDLSSLAGRSVRFILYLSSDGDPEGDRALWIAPSIISSWCTNRIEFVADVTIPDGTVVISGQKFTKTVRLKNIGTCTWTEDYALAFFSGEDMNGPHRVGFSSEVPPGQTVDMAVDLQAPLTPGSYRSYWMLMDPSGAVFGVGEMANRSWWVDIRVTSQITATP
jgi:hypothetical protein